MALLSDTDLANLRSVATEAMPGTAVIQTSAWVSDGGGGGSTGWTASGTVECRIAPAGGYGAMESQTGGRISADAEYVVTIPHNADVSTDSRLVVSDENFGGTFNVEAVRERSWNVTTRVEVRREEN